MQLQLLHLDDALKSQAEFLRRCRELQAREIDMTAHAKALRLWGKEAAIQQLNTALPAAHKPTLTFMGSGDFHHVSALLIAHAAEKSDAPLTVIHFDNHPDWVHFSGGMHCGSWVNRVLELPQVEKIITLGPCSHDLQWSQFKRANLAALSQGKIVLLPWQSPSRRFRRWQVAAMPLEDLFTQLDALISTRNIYITIDKDVLPRHDAITNWDQGQMPLATLLATLNHILATHHALGIDVSGDYSKPRYDGTPLQVVLKKLEALADQPWLTPDAEMTATINQSSNLALLNCIREAA